MAEAMRRGRVVVGLGAASRVIDREAAVPPQRITVAELGGSAAPFIERFPGGAGSLPVLEAAAAGVGLVSITPEADGILRRVPLLAEVGGRMVPTLALEMLRVATGQGTVVLRSDRAGIESVILQGVAIPSDPKGRMFVHFGARRPELYVSAVDVLSGKVGPERIKGRFVLIGTSAAGLGDIKATPVAASMAGVEVHAHVLETVLYDDHLRRPAKVVGAERAFVVVMGLLLVVIGPAVPAALLPVLLLVAVGTSLGGSWLAFTRYGLLIDGAYPALGFVLLVMWLALARYVREQTRRRRVRSTFSLYLSPQMVDQLSRSPGRVALGGERRDLTVMFSDIRDFTKISEGFAGDPEALTRMINRYLTAMSTAILRHDGTIDKYIGDAIMAFWNAPIAAGAHARAGCLAALEMQMRLRELNTSLGSEFASRGMPFEPIRMGIGINTGPCFVGNLGSEQRFNYSALGDTVNVAARLESQTKEMGATILIGEETRAAAPDLATLPLGSLVLKGKSAGIDVHALVGNAAVAASDSFHDLQRAHRELFEAFEAGDIPAAGTALKRCLQREKKFGLEAYYHGCYRRIEAARLEAVS
jgi:adenylate cyclase